MPTKPASSCSRVVPSTKAQPSPNADRKCTPPPRVHLRSHDGLQLRQPPERARRARLSGDRPGHLRRAPRFTGRGLLRPSERSALRALDSTQPDGRRDARDVSGEWSACRGLPTAAFGLIRTEQRTAASYARGVAVDVGHLRSTERAAHGRSLHLTDASARDVDYFDVRSVAARCSAS